MPLSLAGEKKWSAEHAGPMADENHFSIETKDGTHIGVCSYHQVNWQARNCMVGWFIGDASARNRGYGSDMIRLLIKICFRELDMHRFAPGVFLQSGCRAALRARGLWRGRRIGEGIRHGQAVGRLRVRMLRSEYDALYGVTPDVRGKARPAARQARGGRGDALPWFCDLETARLRTAARPSPSPGRGAPTRQGARGGRVCRETLDGRLLGDCGCYDVSTRNRSCQWAG